MSANHDISKIDDLITTLIDSIKGYEHSAEKVDSADFKALFLDLAAGRRGSVELLQQTSRALGGKPNDFGSAAATIHRRIEDLRVALGGGDAAIVKEIERGEDYLKEEFGRALRDDAMGGEARDAIARAYESVTRGHSAMSALKHQLAH
ncbi:PA2169 family four-helix-bundle protein [Flavisphingomonas formosensis]|uniref:PA2169 family four-helix-bundle protein n=1 Tax=Flavisphingomonas formosensis TaxID=861534 RepID=UPI0012F8E779|nr:PA2169 family four-helix-bundle protein [Sphingomonas formosensis]